MTDCSSPRPTHRLVGVIASFSLVAGVGIAATVTHSMADGFTPTPRAKLGPNLIDNSGFASGVSGWLGRSGRATRLRVTEPGVKGSAHAARLTRSSRGDAVIRDQRSGGPLSAAGRVYQATAWVKATNQPVSGYLRLLEWKDGVVQDVTREPFSVRATRWQRVGLLATATSAGGRLQMTLLAKDLGQHNGLTVDRVRLHPVDLADPTVTPTTPLPDASDDDGDPTVTATPSGSPVPTSTESPTPKPTKTPRTRTSTLYGASVYEAGRSWTQAVADSNASYGGMEVVRVFYPGLPSPWPGRAGQTGGPIVVSFKADPADVLAGKHDAYLSQWFQTAPTDRRIWWTYWHEPEDDVEDRRMTAQAWRDAYRRIAGLANAAENPRLRNTVILMCWTVNPRSGRTFENYFPGSDVVEALGWDCYSTPTSTAPYARPSDIYGRAIAKSKELGLPFGIAETGSLLVGADPTGDKRGAWLREVGTYLSSQNARFVTYFDSVVGGEFRLLDEPSRTAWHDVVTTH